MLDRLRGEVTYRGLWDGVDLRCKLGRGFKDELIFARRENVRPVIFLLESQGRSMTLDAQNVLTVKGPQGEAAFRLSAPFLTDADGRQGAVAVVLEARENGGYALRYTPDPDFIQQAAFPITLDPTVESARGETGIEDTFVQEGSSNVNNASDQVWVCNNSTYGKRYGYMRVVNLPKLEANHFIIGAFLHLKNHATMSAETPLMCSEVLDDWRADTITFATQPAVNPLYQDYCKYPASQYTWQRLDVTSLARKWYMGNNKGVILTPPGGLSQHRAHPIQQRQCEALLHRELCQPGRAGGLSDLRWPGRRVGGLRLCQLGQRQYDFFASGYRHGRRPLAGIHRPFL